MPQRKTWAETKALWVKALAAKPDGQWYLVSQMCGVESKIDSHKLSSDLQECCDTDSMSGSMHTHTQEIIHATTKKNSSAGTFMEWKKTSVKSQLITELTPRRQPNPAGQPWLTNRFWSHCPSLSPQRSPLLLQRPLLFENPWAQSNAVRAVITGPIPQTCNPRSLISTCPTSPR